MDKKIYLLILIVVILAGIIFYNLQSKAETFKIGTILVLSGPGGSAGASVLKGMEFALENQNKIQLVVEDSKNDVISAKESYNKLKNIDNVNFIFGQGSSVGLGLKDDLTEDKIITLWIAAHPKITENASTIFRNLPTSKDYISEIIKYLNSKNIKNVSLAYIKDDFGESLKDTFTSKFKENIVATESFNKDQLNNLDVTAMKLLEKNPEAIFIGGYGSAAGELIKKIRYYKYTGIIIGTPELSQKEVISSAGDALKDTYIVSAPLSKEFIAKCKEKFEGEPDFGYLLGYVGTKIIVDCINVKNPLECINNYNKDIEYVGRVQVINNEIKYPLALMQFDGKKFVVLK